MTLQRGRGDMMWAQRLTVFGLTGLSSRAAGASRDGLLRVSAAGCTGRKQQRAASSAEVSGVWVS